MVFSCFFSSRFCENGAQWIWRFARPVEKNAKSLQKAPSFEEQKLWKTPTFWSFWNFTERKNFVIFGWFSETFSKNFKHFSQLFYLKAQQLFSMVKFECFLTLEAVVRAEKQNRKNENCLIPRVGFQLFWKKWSEMIKISETALTTAFSFGEKQWFWVILSIDFKNSKNSPMS